MDGFRLDLGTTLGRRADGFDPAAPLLQAIAHDPALRGMKIIAEPWDPGPEGYRLGAFPAGWGEWNDRCRDAMRRFWQREPETAGELADALVRIVRCLLSRSRPPSRSINFVTRHDGFTLADLVSYEVKHNEANGEGNRDGHDVNDSWNHGVEGVTDDPVDGDARERDMSNLLATLLVARGTPMLSMGDELGRTQRGNNNAYAQDNASGWIDWDHADDALVDFVAALCALRRGHPALHAIAGSRASRSTIPAFRTSSGAAPTAIAMTSADWRLPGHQLLVAGFYAPRIETARPTASWSR